MQKKNGSSNWELFEKMKILHVICKETQLQQLLGWLCSLSSMDA
jgi:hypothetical protein